MELNSNSNHEDNPVAFVRDWRIRKISPSKGINQDGAPIVRRRTVITIGSVGELKDSSTYGPEEHSISTSEVGETACGRISITVKTLTKTDLGRSNSLFNPDVEEEWPTRDVTSPIQRNKTLVNDSKDLGRSLSKVWQQDVGILNKNSVLIKNGLDSGQRQIDSITGITIPKLYPQKISFQLPTFKTFESKSSHLTNQEQISSGIEKQIQPTLNNLASPTRIQYREWIKTLDRSDCPAPNPSPFSSDDAKVTVTTNLPDDCQRNFVVYETSPSPCPPKSILKNGHNGSFSGESKRSDLVVRQDTNYLTLNRRRRQGDVDPISVDLIENNAPVLGRIGIINKADAQSDEKIPYNIPKLSPVFQNYLQESSTEDGDNPSVDVANKNQINSMKSDNTCPSYLSSGMAIDKATELVRQFFSTTQPTPNQEEMSSIADKKMLSASESNLLFETQSDELLPTSVRKHQEVSPQQQQDRGRSPVKSKIPLRIPARSSAVCSNNKSLHEITVESRGIVGSRNISTKAKPIVSNRVKAYSTGRTRSVESSRNPASSLFNPVLYNGNSARNERGYDIKAIGYNKNKANTFQQVNDRFTSYNC